MENNNLAISESLAAMVIEWVDGGISMGTDWRTGLASVIERRLDRLNPQHRVLNAFATRTLSPDELRKMYEQEAPAVRTGGRQTGKSWLRQTTGLPCPNHGNSHCVQCFWPPRYEGAVFDKAILDEMICAPRPGPESAIAEAVHNMILHGTGAYTVQIADNRLTATAIKTGEYIIDSGYDGFDNGVD